MVALKKVASYLGVPYVLLINIPMLIFRIAGPFHNTGVCVFSKRAEPRGQDRGWHQEAMLAKLEALREERLEEMIAGESLDTTLQKKLTYPTLGNYFLKCL